MGRKSDTARLTRGRPHGALESPSSRLATQRPQASSLLPPTRYTQPGACSDRDLKRNTYAGNWFLAVPVHAVHLVATAPTNACATWGETAPLGLCPGGRWEPRGLQRRSDEGAAGGGYQTGRPGGLQFGRL